MEIIYLFYPLQFPVNAEPSSMAIGFFDGVHKGHQNIIKEAIHHAKKCGFKSSVMTFSPHPRELFGDRNYSLLLTPLESKLKIFQELGVDIVYVTRFNESFAKVSEVEFVEDILIPLQIKGVTVGFDFTFGYQGKGKGEDLRELSSGRFPVNIISSINNDIEKISSTLIRKELNEGNIEEVNHCLGRKYRIYGKFTRVEGRDFSLVAPFILPKSGMYDVEVGYFNQWYRGVLSINHKFEMEVYVENFLEKIGQEKMEIKFLHLITISQDELNQVVV